MQQLFERHSLNDIESEDHRFNYVIFFSDVSVYRVLDGAFLDPYRSLYCCCLFREPQNQPTDQQIRCICRTCQLELVFCIRTL